MRRLVDSCPSFHPDKCRPDVGGGVEIDEANVCFLSPGYAAERFPISVLIQADLYAVLVLLNASDALYDQNSRPQSSTPWARGHYLTPAPQL